MTSDTAAASGMVEAIESHISSLGVVREHDVLRADDPRVRLNPRFFRAQGGTTEEYGQARAALLLSDERDVTGRESEAARPRPSPIPSGRRVVATRLLVVRGIAMAQPGQVRDSRDPHVQELVRLFPDAFIPDPDDPGPTA